MAGPLIVVGGGVAGLALGWIARARGREVVVLEAGSRAGGVIRSERLGGLMIEHGPTSLRGASAEGWAMLGTLGLRGQVLPASADQGRRWLLHGGKLVETPSGPGSFLTTKLLSRRARLRVLAEPFIPGGGRTGETVFDLMARRLGREAADRLGTPLVGGIFGGDPRDVEVEATLPRLVELERLGGSLARGAMRAPRAPADAPKVPVSFRDGMETLPRALAAALGGDLRLDTPVQRVERHGAGWRVRTIDGVLEAGEVAIAVPPHAAAKLLPDLTFETAHAPIAAVHLAWPKAQLEAPRGFGWLAHPAETRDALGAIYVSSIFPDHAPGHTLVRVMLGGTRAPGLPAGSDEALIAHARGVLRQLLGWEAEPSFAHVARALPGIPQYTPGHTARLAALRETGLRWLGWGWTGLGVPDQLVAALKVADELQ